MVISLLI
jgi:hypothetical protein